MFSGLTSPTLLDDFNTSAHIHMGPLGVAGPIIHPFPTAPIGVTSGSFADIWTGLTSSDIAALEAGNTYINIHTVAFASGEIRGQISLRPRARLAGTGGDRGRGPARRHQILPLVVPRLRSAVFVDGWPFTGGV